MKHVRRQDSNMAGDARQTAQQEEKFLKMDLHHAQPVIDAEVLDCFMRGYTT